MGADISELAEKLGTDPALQPGICSCLRQRSRPRECRRCPRKLPANPGNAGQPFRPLAEGDAAALSVEEQDGYRLFKSLGCVSCHQGVNIGGNLFQRHGIFHPLASPKPEILRVPSLRNVAATPPYFHDGSTATLDEAVRKMGMAQLNSALTDEQVSAIVAYLRTLTGKYRGVPLGGFAMKMTPAVVLVSFLLLLLTWLLLSGLNLNSTRFDQQLEALDHFSRLERALNCEVLTARAGLSRNYDALARLTDAYDEFVHQLREAAGSDAEESAAIDILAAGAHRQQSPIEQFKSRNALLRNSFLYFGMFSARLAASDRTPVVAAATTLSAAMLHLTLDTSPAAAREVKDRLEQLAALPDPGDDPPRYRRRSRTAGCCMTCCRRPTPR